MEFYRPAALVFGLCTGLWSTAQAAEAAPQLGLPADVMASMQGIDPHRIAEQVRFLADDLLEGRGPGTRGGDIAANYIAAQFALYGLKPAGDNGSYLQKVDFMGVKRIGFVNALPIGRRVIGMFQACDFDVATFIFVTQGAKEPAAPAKPP